MANPILLNGTTSPYSVYESVQAADVQSGRGLHPIGTKGVLGDRVFYWAKNAGAALTHGQLCTHPAASANHISVAWASGGAASQNKVTVTLGATAATANEYAEGYLIVIDGTGSGTMRIIKSHPAADASATLELTLYDNFTTASVTGDEISLVRNIYNGVIVHPGNASPLISGVPQFTVPAGSTTAQYFWLQTWGPASVQGDGSTFVAGSAVIPASAGTADAGQVTLAVETGTAANSQPAVGFIMNIGDAASDLDFRLVDLRIRA